jgi:hypothetical protein
MPKRSHLRVAGSVEPAIASVRLASARFLAAAYHCAGTRHLGPTA